MLVGAVGACERRCGLSMESIFYYFAFVPSDGKGQRARGLGWHGTEHDKGEWLGRWFVRVEEREGGMAADSFFFSEEKYTL